MPSSKIPGHNSAVFEPAAVKILGLVVSSRSFHRSHPHSAFLNNVLNSVPHALLHALSHHTVVLLLLDLLPTLIVLNLEFHRAEALNLSFLLTVMPRDDEGYRDPREEGGGLQGERKGARPLLKRKVAR